MCVCLRLLKLICYLTSGTKIGNLKFIFFADLVPDNASVICETLISHQWQETFTVLQISVFQHSIYFVTNLLSVYLF